MAVTMCNRCEKEIPERSYIHLIMGKTYCDRCESLMAVGGVIGYNLPGGYTLWRNTISECFTEDQFEEYKERLKKEFTREIVGGK